MRARWRRPEASGLEGRMFSHFIWGGYLMHEWPEQRVFIDGGTDHYGEKLFNEYIQVWNLDPGWRDVLKRWNIGLALLPPDSRLADELERDQGWRVWHCDSTAVLLQRPGGTGAPLTAVGRAPARRCARLAGGTHARRPRRAPSAGAPARPPQTASEQKNHDIREKIAIRGQKPPAARHLRPDDVISPRLRPRRLSGLVGDAGRT